MKRDQIVTVLIEEVTEHVIKVSCKGKHGVIQIPELTWNIGTIDPNIYVKKGNLIKTRILKVTDTTFSASIKKLQNNNDPWLKVPNKGSIVEATIYSVVDYGYWLNVKNNIQGVLLEEDSISKHSEGDKILFEITDINNEKHIIHGKEIEQKL